jgi:prepilin-type N-terminal cleavage/methylation domain-containing protein
MIWTKGFLRPSACCPRESASKRGYTLIELLIVMSITLLISSFSILYGRMGARQIALYVEAQKIAEIIFRAKILATSAHQDASLICGYGVVIDYAASTYQIFSYDPPNPNPRNLQCNTVATSGINPANVNFSSAESLKNKFNLNPDLAFAVNADSIVYILFIAPYPTTLISDSSAGTIAPTGKIYMNTVLGGNSLAVDVSSGGQVNF